MYKSLNAKPRSEFFKMGTRLCTHCKICIRAIRRKAYIRKCPTRNTQIGNVIEIYVEPKDRAQFARELLSVEIILENLIYKILSGRIKAQEK